jgi:mRNA interferase MazF
MRYRRGDVVLLAFPFTSAASSKQRPALVILDTGDQDIVVARITTQLYRSPLDVELADWNVAGLLAPSVVRVHKLATIERSIVRRSLGSLTTTDLKSVQTALAQVLVS